MKYIIYSNHYSIHERQTKKNGKVYDLYFRVYENGKEKQKKISGCKTKTEAKDKYNKFIVDYCDFQLERPKKAEALPSDTLKTAFGNYCEYLAANCKPGTLYDVKSVFDSFIFPKFGNSTLAKITKEEINRWQDWVSIQKKPDGKYYSYKYQKKIRGYFSTFLTWAGSRYGFVSPMRFADGVRAKDVKKEMQIWTREEFQRFIDCVDNPLYHALFTFMFFTGRREGEILALSPDDINLKVGTATFNKSITYYKTSNGEPWEIVPTKAYKEQTLPLAKPVIDEMKNFEMGEIFLFGGERPMPTTTVTRYFQKYTEKAGLKRIRIHDLRHSFVSMLIHNGVNLAVVADLISDTLEQVTKTYAHMYSSDREEAIKTLI